MSGQAKGKTKKEKGKIRKKGLHKNIPKHTERSSCDVKSQDDTEKINAIFGGTVDRNKNVKRTYQACDILRNVIFVSRK